MDKNILTSISLTVSKRSEISIPELKVFLNSNESKVSPGRFLILLNEYSRKIEPTTPIESIVLQELMQKPIVRDDSWLFFGNGAIRGYTDLTKKLTSTWSWTILQKMGEKPLAKRHTSTQKVLKHVSLPVKHPAFTRDVANNVWHLPDESLITQSLSRFQSLLTWPDEDFLVSKNGRRLEKMDWTPMDLSSDLVGVAKKNLYSWNNEDTLF